MNDETQKALIERFSAEAEEAEALAFIARATELQIEQVQILSDFHGELEMLKSDRISERDEDGANLVLSLECMIEALRAELQMWVELKSERPEEAWDQLVLSQNLTQSAMRAHKFGQVAARRLPYYETIEEIIFPPQMFCSIGAIVGRRECSICKESYDECSHVAGRPYMGRMCSIILRDCERLDEESVVDDPADKRCRVVGFSDSRGFRNKMTWRLDPSKATDTFMISGHAARYSNGQ